MPWNTTRQDWDWNEASEKPRVRNVRRPSLPGSRKWRCLCRGQAPASTLHPRPLLCLTLVPSPLPVGQKRMLHQYILSTEDFQNICAEGKHWRSQAKKSSCGMLPFIHNSRKWKQVDPQWQKADQWFPREGRSGQEELQRGPKKLLAEMNMVIILIMVMISQVYTYVKTGQIMHF